MARIVLYRAARYIYISVCMLEFIDSHAHLTSQEVLPHLADYLERACAAGVKRIVNICTNPAALKEGIRHGLFNAGATTPHDAAEEGASCFDEFAKAAKSKQLIAIGETGLDYHYEHSPKQGQIDLLVRYLHLATECSLPVIFHCRDAFQDLFAIVDAELPRSHPVILHCFTGTIEEAKGCVERGWMVSASGIITFKKSEALREVFKTVPLAHLLVETDTPYLAPQSKRGKPNEPSYLPETAACLAHVKGVSLEEIARITTANAEKIFLQFRGDL